jgi:hypothetical protein
LAEVKVRWGEVGFASGKSLLPFNYYHVCGQRMGYHLEEHFVTLSVCWR